MPILTDADIAKFDEQNQSAAPKTLTDADISNFDSENQAPDSINKNIQSGQNPLQATLSYAGQHPFKSVLQGLPETITGESLANKVIDNSPHTAFTPEQREAYKKQWGTYPDKSNELNLGDRFKHLGAAAVDVVSSPINAVGGLITKPIEAGAQAAGGVLSKAKNFLKVDNVNENIAPKAYQAFQDNVSKFTPEIQKFAEKNLKVPNSAIETIKKHGIQDIQQTRDALGDSADPILQKVQAGIDKKTQDVEDAYKNAFGDFEKGGGIIPLNRTKMEMGSLLRRAGYIDKNNKVTALAENDTIENSPLKRILGFYDSLNPKTEAGVTGVNAFQWNLFRNNLSRLSRQDKTLSGPITDILDSLHVDAEKAGLKGIQNARSLARANFQAQDGVYSNSLLKEGKLEKFHNLSEADKRQLNSIEKYTGVNFVNDLSKLATGPHLDKLLEYNQNKFAEDMGKAVNPMQTMRVMREYAPLLGDKTKDVLKMIRAEQVKRGALSTVGAAGTIGLADIGVRKLSGN